MVHVIWLNHIGVLLSMRKSDFNLTFFFKPGLRSHYHFRTLSFTFFSECHKITRFKDGEICGIA